jgi:hypothetical protein
MKKYLAILSATALIGVAPYALANSTTELTVTGLITPAACVPELSNGGIVEHGKVSAKDLKQTTETLLARHTLQFRVLCDSATLYTLKPIDNRPNTGHDGDLFGLGKINGDQKLGGFQGLIRNAIADNVPATVLNSRNNGDTWVQTSYMRPTTINAFGSPADPTTPIAIKELLADLQISTYIARADSLDLTAEAPINGSATLEIKY